MLLHHIRKLKTAFKAVPGPTDRHWLHGHLHLVMYISVILLMNSFNRTKAAVFSCRLRVLRDFPFNSLSLNILNGVLNLILGSIINKLSKKNNFALAQQVKTFYKKTAGSILRFASSSYVPTTVFEKHFSNKIKFVVSS